MTTPTDLMIALLKETIAYMEKARHTTNLDEIEVDLTSVRDRAVAAGFAIQFVLGHTNAPKQIILHVLDQARQEIEAEKHITWPNKGKPK